MFALRRKQSALALSQVCWVTKPLEVGVARQQLVTGRGCLVFFRRHDRHDASGLERIGRVIATVLKIGRVVVDLDEDVGAGEFEGNEVVFFVWSFASLNLSC